LDHRADSACLGFSTSLSYLGRRVGPIWLGSQVNPAHLGRRARFQFIMKSKHD